MIIATTTLEKVEQKPVTDKYEKFAGAEQYAGAFPKQVDPNFE